MIRTIRGGPVPGCCGLNDEHDQALGVSCVLHTRVRKPMGLYFAGNKFLDYFEEISSTDKSLITSQEEAPNVTPLMVNMAGLGKHKT